MQEALDLLCLVWSGLLNKFDRKKVVQKKEEHGGDIMALDFNRVALDVIGERSLIRDKP
ncbi:hypothetical protein HanIR_Chr16g0806431 [Helianthus annuus]|nr:hypothetical protein HanIR_Chr16g0806431 [Helianthus annuus]